MTALASQLIERAAARGLRIAVAESLTGGMLASALVSVPGASRVFAGGVVAYDTSLKHSLLRVDGGLLAARGPVDAEVAAQMAQGVRHACALPDRAGEPRAVDLGIATTGVAGPDPDPQTGQVAGTVWISVSGPGEQLRAELVAGLHGLSRQDIRDATVRAALELAAEVL